MAEISVKISLEGLDEQLTVELLTRFIELGLEDCDYDEGVLLTVEEI